MHTGLEEGNHHFDNSLRNMAAFYEERARGGVGLIVTGGIAPNNAGRVAPLAAMMTTPSDAARHREVTDAVHQHVDANGDGPKIAMQILHSGRYGCRRVGSAVLGGAELARPSRPPRWPWAALRSPR